MDMLRIGKYELTGTTFGKGTYSKVKEAIDLQKCCRVALKIIDLENTHDEYIKNYYSREAQILKELKHPNIVRLYDVIESSKTFVLVLEVMPETLRDYMQRQQESKISEDSARLIFQQLAAALTFVHEKGVLHRDVKLENILYDHKLHKTKLADFGLSNNCDKKSFLKTNCGSPEYSAPEVHAGLPYGTAVDVWSLGVVLFAMVVGRLPFEIDRKKAVSNQKRRDLFLEETKVGLKSPKYQEVMDGLSLLCRSILNRMLNPFEKDRLKMPQVESHGWVMFDPSVDRRLQRKKSPNDYKSLLRPTTAMSPRRPVTEKQQGTQTNFERPTTQACYFRPGMAYYPSSVYRYSQQPRKSNANANKS